MFSSPHSPPSALLSRPKKMIPLLADGSISSMRKLVDTLYVNVDSVRKLNGFVILQSNQVIEELEKSNGGVLHEIIEDLQLPNSNNGVAPVLLQSRDCEASVNNVIELLYSNNGVAPFLLQSRVCAASVKLLL